MMVIFVFLLISVAIVCGSFDPDVYVSCALGGTLCVDGILPPMCVVLGGTNSNLTCTARGVSGVGNCCKNGICTKSTRLLCEYFNFGTWTNGGDSETECYCDPAHACCTGTVCLALEEEPCLEEGGIYYPQSCGSQVCHQYEPKGACCTEEGCIMINQLLCGTTNEWYPNTTCEDSGCPISPRPDYSNIVSSGNKTGRCCGPYSCNNDLDTNECQNTTYNYFEEGVGCLATNHPCYDLGACINDNSCVEYITSDLCHAYGGTFFSGGYCRGFDVSGACYVGDGCNSAYEKNCKLLNGIFLAGESCMTVYGSCCDGNLPCRSEYSGKCSIYTNFFIPNATCSLTSDPCLETLGNCCIEGFCLSDLEIASCNILVTQADDDEINYFLKGECPSTGTCNGKDVDILGREITFSQELNIRDIILTMNTTNITAPSFGATNMSFSLSGSKLSLENFKVDGTRLFMSNSKLEIGNCLTIQQGSSLYVTLSDEEKESIAAGGQVEIASYQCLSGSFEDISSNDDCAEVTVAQFTVVISFLDSCITTPSSAATFSSLLVLPVLLLTIIQ